MSSSDDDGGPGRREIAHRLFAAEFDDADLSYSESDEERAPNYVITPSGARVNRLFLVGVLTETEWVNDDMLRARVVDPTGPFVSYAGQYQPDALGFLERAEPPAFLAVTGKARTFQPEDGDRVFTSVRPESISDVDADTRDRWVVEAAKRTVERVETMAAAMETGLAGDELVAALTADGVDAALASGIALALDHYGTTPAYLEELHRLAEDALEVVAGQRDEVRPLEFAPDEGDGDASALAGDERGSVTEGAVETSTAEATPAGAANDQPSAGPEDEPVTEADATASEPMDADSADADPEDGEASEPAMTGDEPTEVAETAATESEADDDLGDFEPDDDLGDFDPEEDEALTEEERREVEAEFDTGFSTGNEVEPEPDLDPENGAETVPEAEAGGEADAEAETGASEVDADGSEDAERADERADESDERADEPAAEVSLDDAVMDAMEELDAGDGAGHDELVAAVTDRTGADADAVEAAIEDALMSGRCYEPDDGVLKPI